MFIVQNWTRCLHRHWIDLICYKNHIEFHLQYCDKIYQRGRFRHQFKYEQFVTQMEQILKMMHQLKLIHKDIKPDNILYSHQYSSYVLTDFGVSHSIDQKIGQKSRTYFAGTLNFMSKQMQDRYKQIKRDNKKQLAQIDLYYNDRIALILTFKKILQWLIDLYKQIRQKSQMNLSMIKKEQDLKSYNQQNQHNYNQYFKLGSADIGGQKLSQQKWHQSVQNEIDKKNSQDKSKNHQSAQNEIDKKNSQDKSKNHQSSQNEIDKKIAKIKF